MARGFSNIIEFEPAYNEPVEGAGIHGVTMRLGIRGPEGALVLTVYTNWHLPEVYDGWRLLGLPTLSLVRPMAADISFHRKAAEGQAGKHDDCPFIGGGPCFSESHGVLWADRLLALLIREGLGPLRAALAHAYASVAWGQPERAQQVRDALGIALPEEDGGERPPVP